MEASRAGPRVWGPEDISANWQHSGPRIKTACVAPHTGDLAAIGVGVNMQACRAQRVQPCTYATWLCVLDCPTCMSPAHQVGCATPTRGAGLESSINRRATWLAGYACFTRRTPWYAPLCSWVQLHVALGLHSTAEPAKAQRGSGVSLVHSCHTAFVLQESCRVCCSRSSISCKLSSCRSHTVG